MWQKIVKHEGKTGAYLVAFYDELQHNIYVSISTCIDGSWRSGPFDVPIAWMPIPEPPTLASLGVRYDENAEEIVDVF